MAVGADPERQVGVPGTLLTNVPPDPANSLRALVDRELRQKVVAANAADPDLAAMNVRGIGHEFWADDRAGFTREQQQALILYLLTYQPDWSPERGAFGYARSER